jgi:hypothetical protein
MVKRLLTDVLKRLCGVDDLEHWHAVNTLHAVDDGDCYRFGDGFTVPVEDWEPLKNPLQFERIRNRAEGMGFQNPFDRFSRELYLRELRQWWLSRRY